MKKFIYIFDAYCPWCYAFTPVVQRLYKEYSATHEFEVLSGGMYIDDKMTLIEGAEKSDQLKDTYQKIEQKTGVPFGESFFQTIREKRLVMNSAIPAAALAVFRQISTPFSALDFIHQLQYAIYFEGGDPNETSFYEKLAVHFHLDPALFVTQMEEEAFQLQARYDVALAKQLKAESFPRLYLQTAETFFHLISKGYSEYDSIIRIINKIYGTSN